MSTAPNPMHDPDLDQNPDYQACKATIQQCVEDCQAEGFAAPDLAAVNWADLAAKVKVLFQEYGPIVIRILAELGLLSTAEPQFKAANPGSAKPKG